MYKARIEKWRIGRSIKHIELRSMLRALAVRNSQGKGTEFHLRNRTITVADLECYLHRNNQVLAAALQSELSRSPATRSRDLRCYTPPPRWLRQSGDYEMIEKTLQSIGNYVTGCVEKGVWTTDDLGPWGTNAKDVPIRSLWNYIRQANDLWKQSDLEGLRWAIAAASAEIKNVVSMESPGTIQMLAIMYMSAGNRLEMTRAIFRQTRELCEIEYGPSHPLGQVCDMVLKVDPNLSANTLGLSLRKYLEAWERLLGPDQLDLLLLKLSILSDLVIMGLEEPAKAVRIVQEMKKQQYEKGNPSAEFVFSTDWMLSWLLKRVGDTHESLRLTHSCLSQIDGLDLDQAYLRSCQYALYGGLYAGYALLQDLEGKESSLKASLKVATEAWGVQSSDASNCLIRLLALLGEMGRQPEAEEVRLQLLKSRELAGNPFV